MRILVMLLLVLVGIASFVAGSLLTIVGIAEEGTDDHVYDVVFVEGSEECESNELYLSVEDGRALSCTPGGIMSMNTRANLPGLTDAQNNELDVLGADLGAGGLSAADQRQFQDRVDEMLETVPREDRGDYHAGHWGARRAWLGAGLVVVSLIAWVVVYKWDW